MIMGSSTSKDSPNENAADRADETKMEDSEDAERRGAGLPTESQLLAATDDVLPLTNFPSRERLRAWQEAAKPLPVVAGDDGKLPPFPSLVRRADVFKGRPASSSSIRDLLHAQLEDIAQKVQASCETDFDKVDAVYTLIVSADVSKLDIADEGTAADYLQRSREDKHALLTLFQKLLSLCDVQCEIVRGNAKGGGYGKSKAAGPMTEPNHNWLAVTIDGNWHLIDIMWCCQQKTDYYYLTDPELFVLTHLPLDPRWQLLCRPVTTDEFYSMAALQQSFILHGLQLVDQLTNRVSDSTGEEKFRFNYRLDGPPKAFSCNYVLEKKNAAVTSVSGVKLDLCLLIEKRDGTVTYTFYFPSVGEYRIDILCKDAAATAYSNVVTYHVTSKKAFPRLRPFPRNDDVYWGPTDKSRSFGIIPISHNCARVQVEQGNKEIAFECPDSLALAYDLQFESQTKYDLEECIIDYYDDTRRYVCVLLPEAGYFTLNIYAYHSEQKRVLACRYLLDCARAFSGKLQFQQKSRLGHQPIRRALLDAIDKRSIALLRTSTKMAHESKFVYLIASENATALALLGTLERLDKIKSDVMKENKTVISEVRSYSKPPAAVHDMLNACLLLLGECEIPYIQWVDLQKKCGNTGTDGLGKRISDLDIRSVHPEMAARARQIVDAYKTEDVSKATPTAALFHAWVWGVCQEVLCDDKHYTKPADLARQKEIARRMRRKPGAEDNGGSQEDEVIGHLPKSPG